MSDTRAYDMVLLGAYGYTASICAEYIAKNLPTTLKWAVAGRSQEKLDALVVKLRTIHGNRQDPAVEIVELNDDDLGDLATRARLIVNGIGPYHLYSSPVVKACAKAGTHYIGFSLETPWVEKIMKANHKEAKINGAIIIPTVALSPSDILNFLVASSIRAQPKSEGCAEVLSTAKLELQGMSGSSLSTVLSLIATYGTSWISPGNPYSLSSSPPSTIKDKLSLTSRLFGYGSIAGLGKVTTSFLAICNESIAHRSASLLPGIYGHNFHTHEYLPVSSAFSAVLVHFFTKSAIYLLAFPPLRWLLQSMIPAPGTGPDIGKANVEKQMFEAIGTPVRREGKQVKGRFVYEGSLYYCSAMMAVEAARVLLEDEARDVPAKKLGGGILTPATLGMSFVERLRDNGVSLGVSEFAG